METTKPGSIDEYIAGFPQDISEKLEQVRATIQATEPEAEEATSYGIPAFNLHGRYLIYFAAHTKHIGVYPVPSGVKEFEKEFSAYKTSGKGTIQFPYNKPLPLHLITRIVKYRAQQNLVKTSKKNKGKR